ncbi:solute carrier family 28 member 3 isoform X2 [Mauremys mutica]|uniref:solute carrier family 28 member 3 isoform X2 n=1 Tax=Mauremys mutica TaxID=74926 RepID=UPI001D1682AE|nr:solute carrier family 28 member 3 isoform X2 [Mauremys mutica]
MELKENISALSGADGFYNASFQNDSEDDVINEEGLRSRNLQNRDAVHSNPEDTHINIESDQHKNKQDSVAEKIFLKGYLERKYEEVCDFCKKYKTRIRYVIYGILIAAYLMIVIAACVLNFQRALALFVLTVLAIFFICWDFLIARYEDKIAEFFSPCERFLKQQWFWLKWVVWIALIAAIICWLIFDTAKQGTNQLISFGGLVMYVLLMLIFSKYPTKVAWRPVFWGIGLQFILGLVTLRTKAGFDVFNWLGRQIQIFLEYSDDGAKFVFGEKYTDHLFAFKVLPIVVFFSTVVSMLYHVGFMQWLINKVGWIMQVTLGTTPVESLVAAGNIFVGQTESPLLVRPYLPYVTKSELHSIMTSGFSTIAGSVLGAYISFGVSASHLLTASVMSAPASLAISKLFWPETKIPQITLKSGVKMEKGDSKNLLEAASQGASASIPLVANIAVNLIAFLALLSFVDSALSWLGNMFNYPQLNFEIRSETIATYALCGFANFGSLGMVIGGLTSMAPSKKRDIADSAFRAMIAGTVACFMTACIAGILSVPVVEVPCHILLGDAFNVTNLPSNTTKVVGCCQDLFNSTTANNSQEIVLGGNYSLSSLRGCCQMLDSPTFNCSWTTSLF